MKSTELIESFTDFPFDEIRKENGDYFNSIEEAQEFGLSIDQIWSVVESDNTLTYGPSRHFVNLIGYIGTKETHDNNTYYHEQYDIDA